MTTDKGEETLRDTIRNAMAETKAPEEVAPEKEATDDSVSRETMERTRDEQGRFAKKDDEEPKKSDAAAEPPPAADTPADKKAPPAVTSPGTEAPEAPRQTSQAPKSWPSEMRSHWEKVPTEAQRYLLGREREIQAMATRQDDDRKFGQELKAVTQPYLAMIQAEGSNPKDAVQAMLALAYELRTASPERKTAGLLNLARQFNVQLTPQAVQAAGNVNPQVAALEQRLRQFELQAENEKRAQKQAEKEAVDSEIEGFRSDPSHPHFEEVKDVMASLLDGKVATSLQDAYERACWADPIIRSTLTKAGEKQDEAKRKTVAAKAAAVSVTGAPGTTGSSTKPPDRSLRDELRANMRALNGGRV